MPLARQILYGVITPPRAGGGASSAPPPPPPPPHPRLAPRPPRPPRPSRRHSRRPSPRPAHRPTHRPAHRPAHRPTHRPARRPAPSAAWTRVVACGAARRRAARTPHRRLALPSARPGSNGSSAPLTPPGWGLGRARARARARARVRVRVRVRSSNASAEAWPCFFPPLPSAAEAWPCLSPPSTRSTSHSRPSTCGSRLCQKTTTNYNPPKTKGGSDLGLHACSPEASFSARSCSRLPRAPARLGRPAALAVQTGLGFGIGSRQLTTATSARGASTAPTAAYTRRTWSGLGVRVGVGVGLGLGTGLGLGLGLGPWLWGLHAAHLVRVRARVRIRARVRNTHAAHALRAGVASRVTEHAVRRGLVHACVGLSLAQSGSKPNPKQPAASVSGTHQAHLPPAPSQLRGPPARLSERSWLSLWPAGSQCQIMPQAARSFGQSNGWAALAGYTGLAFDLQHARRARVAARQLAPG
eukprot:scaffold891_cov61-Phaeocystis_antarctica.AAC.2